MEIVGRRELLLGAIGAASSTALAGAQTPRRAPVILNGRRVQTVDIHAHVVIDVSEITKNTPLLGKGAALGPNKIGLGPRRLADMDRMGIDVQVLSINPFWYGADQPLASQLIEFQNAALADACATSSGRFVAMATVALQHPDAAAQQLISAVKRYGMRAVAIGASVEGQELSSPRFDPFWKAAQETQALVLIHPQQSDVANGLSRRLQGPGALSNVIGNPLETTIALSHLIFDGVLDRFPSLKLCAVHGGGYLPSYAGRIDHGCDVFPDHCTGPSLKHPPSDYLKRLYYDSLLFTPEGLRHLAAEVGPRQIMLGTDYPFPWVKDPVGHVLSTPGLSDMDKASILGGTASALFFIA